MPHMEGDAVDPECRHKGKLDSEQVLARSGVRWTSIRPVYIYGPLNYNPGEIGDGGGGVWVFVFV